jgi:hypothetical protein
MDSLGQVAEFAALTPTSSICHEVSARTSLILADCIGAVRLSLTLLHLLAAKQVMAQH